MNKKYPDPTGLFVKKEAWRQQMNERPIEQKLMVATRLREAAREIPKLGKTATKN